MHENFMPIDLHVKAGNNPGLICSEHVCHNCCQWHAQGTLLRVDSGTY